MDLNSKAKNNVLSELIKLMEDRELGELKGKSPKFAKVDIKSDDPELLDNLKSKLMGEEEASESPEEESAEAKLESLEPKDSSEDEDDLERLRELYSKLK